MIVQRSCGRKDLVVMEALSEDLCDWGFVGKERGREETCGAGRGQVMLRLTGVGFTLGTWGSFWRALSSQGTHRWLRF